MVRKQKQPKAKKSIDLVALAQEALVAGAKEGARRVSNALGLLRHLKARDPSTFQMDEQLNALEQLWTRMRRAGLVRGEPKLSDKKLERWLIEQSYPGKSSEELADDLKTLCNIMVEPEWVADIFTAGSKELKGGGFQDKNRAFDFMHTRMQRLGLGNAREVAVAIQARIGAFNTCCRQKRLAKVLVSAISRSEGRQKLNEIIARCPLHAKQESGQGVEGLTFYFELDEVEAMLETIV